METVSPRGRKAGTQGQTTDDDTKPVDDATKSVTSGDEGVVEDKTSGGVHNEIALVVCAAGIFGCYLSYGYFQENLYSERSDGTKFGYTTVLLWSQCSINFLLATLSMLVLRNVDPTLAWKGFKGGDISAQGRFAFAAGSYILAMLCSNEALKYVSYPTQALGKSCKLVGVMMAKVLITRAQYSSRKIFYVLMMTAAVIGFQLAKKSSQELGGDWFGFFLLFLSLFCDGITGPSQEILNHRYKPSNLLLMALINGYALVYLTMAVIGSGAGIEAFTYLRDHPDCMLDLVLFGLMSALGQCFIFYTVRTFDSLVLTTITTTRKFATIVLSVVMHGHVLQTPQWVCVVVVFGVVIADIVDKRLEKSRKAAAATPSKSE